MGSRAKDKEIKVVFITFRADGECLGGPVWCGPNVQSPSANIDDSAHSV